MHLPFLVHICSQQPTLVAIPVHTCLHSSSPTTVCCRLNTMTMLEDSNRKNTTNKIDFKFKVSFQITFPLLDFSEIKDS